MKIYKILYIIVFFAVICLPFVGLLVYKQPENTENKTSVEMPHIVEEGKLNIKYLQELRDWYEEHFAYRQELVTLNAYFNSELFGESSEELAIVGKDGWLYLKASLPDYQGTNLVSDRRYRNVVRTIYLMQEYVEAQGKKFVFTVAPNKNTLYPVHMPDYFRVINTRKNLDNIESLLKENGINYVDLKAEFLSREEELYHKGDSHWNNKGAAIVQNLLLEACDIPHTDFTLLDYKITDDFVGDIDKIMYPSKRHTEIEYDYTDYMNFNYDNTDDVTAVTVETTNKDKQKGLLCYRDSFGNSLIPFLANEFKHCTFSKSAIYSIDRLAASDYDVCIIEVVERNITNLVKFAPVMPAPLRNIDGTISDYKSDNSTIYWTNYDNYYKISGYVDSSYLSFDSEIYIKLTSEDCSFTLEAFPVDEQGGEEKSSDYGFTAYLGNSALPVGSYSIEVITRKEDTYYSYMSDEVLEFR